MSDNIDDMLKDLEGISIENKSIEKANPLELDVTDREDLATELIKVTRDDRKMADKLFELFYPEIMSGQDRSQASKEALTKALELKISAGRNIIDLLKVMKQEEKNQNSIGVFFTEKKAGINLDNIKTFYSEDDDDEN